MSTSGLGAGPPRKLRGRAAKEWDARAAQDAAAESFARMDAAQRALRARFPAAAGDPAEAAEFAELDGAAETQAKRYLDTVDRHPVATEVDKGGLLAAAVELRQAAFDCAALADRLEDFARRHPAA